MRLFLGIDGGQSGTEAVIGDASGRILGRGSAGPCNHVGAAEGRAKLTRAVTESLGAALAAAGLNGEGIQLEAACCGMSGGPDDKREILAELLPAGRLEVVTDAHIALTGALAGFPGAIVIAGTGSIALAETAGGRTARAGGWGYVFGDEGGAFDLVRQALRAALCSARLGAADRPARQALACHRRRSANDLLHRFTPATGRGRASRRWPRCSKRRPSRATAWPPSF